MSFRRERPFRQTCPPCSIEDPCATLQTILTALKQCSKVRDLESGQRIHQHLTRLQFDSHLAVSNTLLNMYSRCGDLSSAREIFNLIGHKTTVTWNCMIFGYVNKGESVAALELFNSIDCEPSLVTYVAALKACGGLADQGMEKQLSLRTGMALHERIRQDGLSSHLIVASSLVDMYCKCGEMRLARDVFDGMPRKTAITWTSLLFGYVANGESHTALKLYDGMDCEPDHITLVAAAKACTGLATENPLWRDSILERGISIHERSKKLSICSGILLPSALVEMYSRCGEMNLAKVTFDEMSRKDAVAWNCLIQGYLENGQGLLALELFHRMNVTPDAASCVAALKACSALASEVESETENVQAVHETIKKLGLESEPAVVSSLVDVYCKLGRVEHARDIFERTPRKDVVTWTCLILGYVNVGENLAALELFDCMDCEPDDVTYAAVLRACTGMVRCRDSERQAALKRSMLIHERIKERGLEPGVSVGCALMKLYSSYGKIDRSREVFERMTSTNKTVVAWTCIISGYVDNGQYSTALELFTGMDVQPDEITYIAALKACTGLASDGLRTGIGIHEQLKERSFGDLHTGIGSTLVNMYRKCGGIGMAREVFDRLSFKDVVTWTNLILGYLENGELTRALTLFDQMDCKPDPHSYAVALKACGCCVALPHGQRIHATVCKLGLELDAAIVNTLVEFYGRCGCFSMAEEMFCSIDSPDTLSWNALMAACSVAGDSRQVLNLAVRMQEAGLQMNACTFLHVLVACSHGGSVQKGEVVFDCMKRLRIAQTVEHYTCMIDMLCRAGKFEEASSILLNMPFEADGIAWKTLLAACKKWNNFNAAKMAFDQILYKDDNNVASACVLMGDICKSQLE